jgi:tripartite-type tricarboxylate transporter receptor subunit TctC
LPEDVVTRLNQTINKALQSPALVQAIQDGGMTSLANTPERFEAFIRTEIDKYAQVIRQARITSEG